MNRPWNSLSTSSRAYVNHCYNVLVRAVSTTVVVVALLGLSVVLNWVVHKSLEQVGASIQVQDILSLILIGNLVAMAVGIALINLLDVWSLIRANARSTTQDDEEPKDG